jgi:hypothetical protein
MISHMPLIVNPCVWNQVCAPAISVVSNQDDSFFQLGCPVQKGSSYLRESQPPVAWREGSIQCNTKADLVLIKSINLPGLPFVTSLIIVCSKGRHQVIQRHLSKRPLSRMASSNPIQRLVAYSLPGAFLLTSTICMPTKDKTILMSESVVR